MNFAEFALNFRHFDNSSKGRANFSSFHSIQSAYIFCLGFIPKFANNRTKEITFMPTLIGRIDMIYLNNKNCANSRKKETVFMCFGFKLTRGTFLRTKNKSNCSSKGSKSVKVPYIYGNFTYVCTLIHDRVSLRMDAILAQGQIWVALQSMREILTDFEPLESLV